MPDPSTPVVVDHEESLWRAAAEMGVLDSTDLNHRYQLRRDASEPALRERSPDGSENWPARVARMRVGTPYSMQVQVPSPSPTAVAVEVPLGRAVPPRPRRQRRFVPAPDVENVNLQVMAAELSAAEAKIAELKQQARAHADAELRRCIVAFRAAHID